MNAEQARLKDQTLPWKRWGPYLSERQWGTVREDYSATGNAWDYLPHEAARSVAYRWGEDGIAGVCDDQQNLCLSLALWNGQDPFLKERLFGLTGSQGNHGEDVKEYYYYLDNTPTHSYMKLLYKYPQRAFPYDALVAENQRRGREEGEYELIDTGVFDENRYFDVFVEYAKSSPEDLLLQITVHNRGPEEAIIHVLPHIWFRNTWSWGLTDWKPELSGFDDRTITVTHRILGARWLYCDGAPNLLFCDNETNDLRQYGTEKQGYFKDGINDYVVEGRRDAVNPNRIGTRAASHYRLSIPAGKSTRIRALFCDSEDATPFVRFDATLAKRRREADAFYKTIQSTVVDEDARNIQRQAFAGMLWSKQFYYYDVPQWLNGDPGLPAPPPERKNGRNQEWTHLNNADVLSMPDKWEYPWFAAWDLAFHCIPLAMIDPDFAKEQLVLLTREWYMHPNGQLPAYEWSFGDVNPPVHAWAAWRVYEIDRSQRRGGKGDTAFLERILHKLLLNFTWWVNRKDADNHNIFQGGFLGLDNIGVFDRSAVLPTGGHIEQSDATSWMAMYSLNLMRIALELARTNPVYEDIATKFFEHFLHIAGAMVDVGGKGFDLWDEEDSFFYDVLHLPDRHMPLKVRSMVGLIPLFAVEVLEPELLNAVPGFKLRLEWFLNYRPDLASLVSRWQEPGSGERRLLSLLRGHRMKCLLKRMLDETEFLSDYGVRALSRYHLDQPYVFVTNHETFTVSYQPAESDSGLFGGNSNWRGPIWFPVNFLLIESLRKFHHYYGDDFKVECPTGSGRFLTLQEVADELSLRLSRLFLRDEAGRRPVFGDNAKFQSDPHFRDHLPFYEYFHGDTGRGVGAAHQTGWTGLIAKLLSGGM